MLNLKTGIIQIVERRAKGFDSHHDRHALESWLREDRLSEQYLGFIGCGPPVSRYQRANENHRSVSGNLSKITSVPGEGQTVYFECVVTRQGNQRRAIREMLQDLERGKFGFDPRRQTVNQHRSHIDRRIVTGLSCFLDDPAINGFRSVLAGQHVLPLPLSQHVGSPEAGLFPEPEQLVEKIILVKWTGANEVHVILRDLRMEHPPRSSRECGSTPSTSRSVFRKQLSV